VVVTPPVVVAEAWPGSPMTLKGHKTSGIRAHHCGDTTTTEPITVTAMPQAAHHWELGDHGHASIGHHGHPQLLEGGACMELIACMHAWDSWGTRRCMHGINCMHPCLVSLPCAL